ncbi:Flp pilus assembly protein TadG [Rhizobium alvei]|uniref:Pilus assembly protein TadG-related protein n=2 Tax=Rhizobium alvei TaxID=1132659 RepID=A0ABT8YJ47_9HYPH|nr:pilus assembly protein TadG-related protein [Rhizobium alvei]MDO6963687.1 pilus assembly protein TadG-related protein [Rhizobium alvei]
MSFRFATCVSNAARAFQARSKAFVRSSGGNIAMSFAILAVPTVIAIGVGIDYTRAFNTQARMQADIDAALIAAIKEVDNLDEDTIREKIVEWFAAQTELDTVNFKVPASSVKIDKSNRKITAYATAVVPTTFMGMANIETINVKVASSVAGPATSYLSVYIVLDKSASMLLAATSAGQTTMLNSQAGCSFACHESEGSTFSYGGKSYTNVYDLAKAMGVQLRTDVAVSAVKEVLDIIDSYDSTHSRIKIGLYTLGKTTTQRLAPTFSTSDARKKLADDTSYLTSATSEPATYFDYSMTALKTLVGTGGDGTTADKPLKLVLIMTDGVQSERNWVLQGSSGIRFPSSTSTLQKDVTPINPTWCNDLKNLNATIGVVYTEYLPMTWDWGYNATVGKTMATSNFKSVWGGTIGSKYNNYTRRDYIPVALDACASSSDLFIQASSASEIQAGLSHIFTEYLTNVRLTE